MNPKTIDYLVNETLDTFRYSGYACRSIESKSQTLNRIKKMHKANNLDCYNEDIIQSFKNDVTKDYYNHNISRIRYKHLLKTCDYLTQIYMSGQIDLIHRNIESDLSPYYNQVLSMILKSDLVNAKYFKTLKGATSPYMKWLQKQEYKDFSFVNEVVIRRYLMECSQRMSINSFDTIKRVIKKLHLFLYKLNVTNEPFDYVFNFPTKTEYHIKKTISANEILLVLQSIDISTNKGKRDYAIILLGATTGLRAVDIVNLKLNDIDWINGEVKINQSKTNVSLSLPLTKKVGVAIQDYILNSRPNSLNQYIFLRMKSPFEKLGSGVPYESLNIYRKKLGLEKIPFHSLRRTVGTNLVVSGVPVSTVAQILGHSDIQSTKQYISLDTSNLKQCALSLEDIPINIGGDRI